MNLNQWLRYLETLPSGLNVRSLKHLKKIAAKLKILKFSAKIITIGGTNGKGSCVTFLESILLAAGYKIGTYISPHVLRYNERIKINGKEIDAKSLCRAFAIIEKIRGNTALSYFEYSTLAALTIFQKQKLDVLVLEIGLGGKFDPVNILDPDIAVISTISLDHTKILGNTRNAIAQEKVGIARANKPIVCGDFNPPHSIYTTTQKIKAPLYCINRDFSYFEKDKYWTWRSSKRIITKLPIPKLPLANAATSLMAIELLKNTLNIPRAAIVRGLQKATLLGRWQQITIANKKIIFDVAHNPEATILLKQNLKKHYPTNKILAVVGMLGDKDIKSTFQPLTKLVKKWYLSTVNSPRSATIQKLEKILTQLGATNFVTTLNIPQALQQAIAECRRKDRIVVFGSFLTVAEGLKELQPFLMESKNEPRK